MVLLLLLPYVRWDSFGSFDGTLYYSWAFCTVYPTRTYTTLPRPRCTSQSHSTPLAPLVLFVPLPLTSASIYLSIYLSDSCYGVPYNGVPPNGVVLYCHLVTSGWLGHGAAGEHRQHRQQLRWVQSFIFSLTSNHVS